jgi:hypothetical protein
MSRKSRVTLTIAVKLPIPAGHTQKQVVERIRELLQAPTSSVRSAEMQVSVTAREVAYL